MSSILTKFNFLTAAAILSAGLAVPASAQVNCIVQSVSELLARADGNTEPLGDVVLACTGGNPTPAGDLVPQVDFKVTLNTNLTSRITYASPSGKTTNFSEALLLVDEPNEPFLPGTVGVSPHPLLNCGQLGAPDSGPGPGICEIISTGIPTQTYDGTPSAGPAGTCFPLANIAVPASNVFGCGRPNAFQGMMPASGTMEVDFIGVPFDPPGVGAYRFLRLTNLRSDAAGIASSAPITCTIDIASNSSITFPGNVTSATVTIGQPIKGMTVTTPTHQTVRVAEGFATAFKDRNVAFILANAAYSAGAYFYVSPDQNYPAQAAQNVPGVIYYTEDLFQWQNNGANKPPSPDPPAGYSSGVSTDTNYPLLSVGYGGINTGINEDGASNAGTRIALTFKTLAPSVTVPSVVYLHPGASPSTTSGVMVLTKTDAAGAGPFTTGAATTLHNGETAVYEVLYANPFEIEYGDIEISVNSFLFGAQVTVNFAPFYTVPGAALATPTAAHPTPTAIPRFSTAGSSTVTVSSSLIGIFLPFY
jgi:hypothetical protein